MIKIKSAFKALKNRWIISILLLIQFTFGLSTITGSVIVFYNLQYLNNSSSSVLDLPSTYLLTFNMTTDRINRNFSKQQIEKVYQNMKENKDVISYGTYIEDFIPIEKSSKSLEKKMLAELTNTSMPMARPEIHAITIDKNYNRLLNVQIEQGRGFFEEDFKNNRNEKINVVVGSYFKKYFKTGDVIKNQYTIIGFLPENKFIVNNNTTNTYLKLDKAMLIPMTADRYNESMFPRLITGTILKLRSGADIEKLNQNIQLEGLDVKLYLKNLGEDINKNVTMDSYSEIPQLILGFCFIILSVTGIVLSTIVSIMIRKREFGIKLVFGESRLGIFIQIILENVLIGITGLGLSLAYFTWKYSELFRRSSELNMASALDFKFNAPIIFLVFLILILIIIISNFIVFLFIRKLEPKSLIGGME